MEVLIAQKLEQVPEDGFHFHPRDRAEREQNVHLRRQTYCRVLGIGARQREPYNVLLPPLLEHWDCGIGGAVRGGVRVGNDAVFLDSRSGVLIDCQDGALWKSIGGMGRQVEWMCEVGRKDVVRRNNDASTSPSMTGGLGRQ